jgi:hypothetical protein
MLTNEEIFEEYLLCSEDPKYAIEKYLKTFDKTQEGYVPFKLFKKQREIIDDYEHYRFNLITKPRQAGISTTTQAYAAIKCAFADKNNPETIIVIANKLTLAKKFAKGIKDFVNQLPRWVWGPEYYGTKDREKVTIYEKDSQIEIELINGSKIIAVATSTDALRGYTPTFLIFDEAAFIDKGAELYGAAITSLGTGGKAILISTPNGYDALYYKTYEQSINGDNDYNIIEMKWYQDPRYNKDLRWLDKEGNSTNEIEFTYESFETKIKSNLKPTSTWYEDMCKGMNNDRRRISQELDVSFLGSGGNVIDDEYIVMQETLNVCNPKFIDKKYFDGQYGLIWVWNEPVEGHEYIMACDVARGDGSDSSTFQIIDFTTMEQVCEYQGKIQPDLFAEIIDDYGRRYSAYVVVDNIGVGGTTAMRLDEMKYPNLHYDDSKSRLFNNNNVNPLDDKNKVPGFNVNGVRLNLVSLLEEKVRTNTIKIRSKRLVNEMRTFIYKNSRPDHMEGYHDDCLMALGMGLWILEHSFRKLRKVSEQTKSMLSGWVMPNNESHVSSGFVPKDGRGKKSLPKPKFSPLVSKNMQDPNGDYSWLFSGMK